MMDRPPRAHAALPASGTDVLVIGAGPAGSAAARQLAQAGLRVQLVDQQALGRDKVCGDGLIPDAHRALARLGLLPTVMAEAHRVAQVGFVGPRGGRVEVPGHLAVLPRQRLDELLARGAVEAGAEFVQARFETLLEEGGRCVGAQLRQGDQCIAVRAPWVLLATGAPPKPLQAAGVCQRQSPSSVALRGYVRAPALTGHYNSLDIVMSRAVKPGYGWIFPAPGGVFNIGVGVANSHREGGRKKDINLRRLFDDFVASYEPAARLMREGELVGELKGAPMRCTLQGATPSRPGLMVIGEAVGSTYDFTGEGIGKAMETGLLAADAIAARGADDAAARAQYEAGLATLAPKYRMYQRANTMYRIPGLIDLLIWRAGKSARLRQRMAGVLEETSTPGDLITVRGLVKLFTE